MIESIKDLFKKKEKIDPMEDPGMYLGYAIHRWIEDVQPKIGDYTKDATHKYYILIEEILSSEIITKYRDYDGDHGIHELLKPLVEISIKGTKLSKDEYREMMIESILE